MSNYEEERKKKKKKEELNESENDMQKFVVLILCDYRPPGSFTHILFSLISFRVTSII